MLRRAFLFLALPVLLGATDQLTKELAYRLDVARQLPPAISAAMILKLIEESGLKGELAKDLAVEAYRRALEAAAKPELAYAGKQSFYDAVFNPRGYSKFNPEAVAFRAWALHRENSADKKRLDIDRPDHKIVPRLGCEVFFTPDPGSYYETYFQVEPAAGRIIAFTQSAVELARAMEAIAKDGGRYVGLGQRLLQMVSDGDRGFFYATKRLKLHDSVLSLAGKMGSWEATDFLSAYRGFLLRHFRQRRCSDIADESYAGIIAEFNEAVESKALPGMRASLRLRPEDAKVLAVERSEAEPRYYDASSLAIQQRISSSAIDENTRNEILAQIEAWRAPDKLPAAQALGIRAMLYSQLLSAMNERYQQDRVAREWLQWCGRAGLRTNSVAVWYFSTKSILEKWVNGDRYRGMELETAIDPATAAYATLDRLDRERGAP